MVFNFLRGGPSGMQSVEREVTTMLADCRHTFDLAMSALDAGHDISGIAADIRDTDERINATEEDVRRRLVVHVSVHGGEDVGVVLADLLIVKKLERVGDQHKNILDLADEGVRFTGDPDHAEIQALRQEVSEMFSTTSAILATGDADAAQVLGDRATALRHDLERVVANLAGVAMTVKDGIDRIERDSTGEDVTDD